jgi:hypothetical protein
MDEHAMTLLQQNIDDRKDAEAVAELAGEQRPRFWEELARICASRLPPPPVEDAGPGPMGEQEARRFEMERMAYGAHAGREVGTVPVSYLLWLAEGDDFTRRLRRYVASRTFADRQDEED